MRSGESSQALRVADVRKTMPDDLSLAEIAERLGDTKVVAAEHYMYAIGDYAEVDYMAVLEGAADQA